MGRPRHLYDNTPPLEAVPTPTWWGWVRLVINIFIAIPCFPTPPSFFIYLPTTTMPESYKDIEIRISEACDAFRCKAMPKVNALAREFNVHVPYDRLRFRLRGGNSRSTRLPPKLTLDKAQDQAVIRWITLLNASLAAPTPAIIESCANEILRRHRVNRILDKKLGVPCYLTPPAYSNPHQAEAEILAFYAPGFIAMRIR